MLLLGRFNRARGANKGEYTLLCSTGEQPLSSCLRPADAAEADYVAFSETGGCTWSRRALALTATTHEFA